MTTYHIWLYEIFILSLKETVAEILSDFPLLLKWSSYSEKRIYKHTNLTNEFDANALMIEFFLYGDINGAWHRFAIIEQIMHLLTTILPANFCHLRKKENKTTFKIFAANIMFFFQDLKW